MEFYSGVEEFLFSGLCAFISKDIGIVKREDTELGWEYSGSLHKDEKIYAELWVVF